MVGFCCGVQWTPSQNTLHGREAGTRGFVGSTTSARSAECTPGADEQQTEAPAMAVGGRGSAAYSLHAVLSRPPNSRLRRQAALLDRSLVHRTESNPTFAVEFLLRPPAWIKGYQDGEILDSSARPCALARPQSSRRRGGGAQLNGGGSRFRLGKSDVG
ncbi:hypothetical protein BHM03_00012572 [Ensete ventricosum]|nr:hypothetical protein BHM03_00012572 [Ensete ventricosum]